MRTIACILLVVALAAQPAAAQTSGSSVQLWNLLRQMQQMFDQLRSWVTDQLNSATDAIRSNIAPITDTYHAARSIASWLESLASGLPGEARSLLDGAISRFRSAQGPLPGSPGAAARPIVERHPSSPLARTVRAHEELSASVDLSVARARAAQQVAEESARVTVQDASPVMNLEIASASARELSARAMEVPSTRAAVQLLIEGFAAYMDQNARQNADLSTRLTALVQQQAALSQQLTSLTERTADLVELLNQQRKAEAEGAAATTQALLDSNLGGMRSVVGILGTTTDRSRDEEVYGSIRSIWR